MATKAELEIEVQNLKNKISDKEVRIKELEDTVDYEDRRADEAERDARTLKNELDDLREKYDEYQTGSICQLVMWPINPFGQFLASAIAKVLENGRDLETLELLEKLGYPAKRLAAVEAIAAYELINL